MKSQPIKRAHVKVDKGLHKLLKLASIREDKNLEELVDDVLRTGMKVKKMLPVDHAAA